jgi:TIR domain-containing protein
MIFISYRRGDDPGSTGRLFERLQIEGFSSDQLFMDIDSIAPGIDFLRELHRQVERSDVMLAVIGKGWIDARDATGARRLDSPDDFVRVEIEAALRQDKRVIPVLMQDAAMPRADELPVGLKSLATRNYIRLTHERFRLDTQVLVKALRTALDDVAAAREDAAKREAEELERRRQEEEAARRAQAEREAAEEAARRAQAEREVEEKARQQKEEARRFGIAGLSAEHLTKAEELANWDFIKQSTDPEDFRDHLARFPGGVCERMARHRLSTLAWSALGSERRKEALEQYLKEHPDGPHAADAKRELASLEQQAADRASEESKRVQQVFEAAKREDSVVAVERFLAAHPDSPLAEEAKKLRDDLLERDQAYQDATVGGDPKLLQAFLDAYPTSAAASEVRRMLSHSEPKPAKPKVRLWAKVMLGVIALFFGGVLLATLTPRPAPTPSATPTCPPTSQSGIFELTLNAGFKPIRKGVSPGGSLRLQNCRSDMSGWVSSLMDVGLVYETPGNRTLTIEVSSNINTVLAIYDPNGAWHFNDDIGGGNRNPRIIFPKAARGRYGIWVGKYDEHAVAWNSEIIITDR